MDYPLASNGQTKEDQIPLRLVGYNDPPFEGWWSMDIRHRVSFGSSKYPNWLNRFLQRILLGIYWKKK